ncbi:MAG: hypothetical protein R6X07_04295 [Desulfatiglandales bacterium]|jgi:hypothetical protein
MSVNWGPYFIVPSELAKEFSGIVVLRENFDEELLRKELKNLGLEGAVLRVMNPWYYRQKASETWVKIGESDLREDNFPVRWDTSRLPNGTYEVLGLMHVVIKIDDQERIIARQNIVEVTLRN